MVKTLLVDADHGYRQAERKAARYFDLLNKQVVEQAHVPALTSAIQLWKRTRIRRPAWRSMLAWQSKRPHAGDGYRYIQWLQRNGKLDDYLERSVSYMFMRDLGKSVSSSNTQAKIKRTAADIKRWLQNSAASGGNLELISLASLYRWAQKESVETTIIWAIDKLKHVAAHIPEGMSAEHAQRKLIKIIVGVVLHALEEMNGDELPAERARRLDEAIRLGYCYGLTYPFIDDLLDAQVLTDHEKTLYSQMIRTTLLTGTVPAMGEWKGMNRLLLQFAQSELREAFSYIKRHQPPKKQALFFEQAFVFFHAQELDRAKDLSDASYSNEDLYVPIILKSASSRLLARSILAASHDEEFEQHTFYYGIYNQLADDFADMETDKASGAVTPYTYYLTHRDQRPDLINPYELYWTVIFHLIQHVYRDDGKACEVILDRAINGLRRCKERIGSEEYGRLMKQFAFGGSAFHRLLQQMVDKAENVDFFDKLLRDRLVGMLRDDQSLKQEFHDTVHAAREQINESLPITKTEGLLPMKELLIDAANYSLAGDGKRLRPVMTWFMGVQYYGLTASSIVPLWRSLEYMHTASLIFDDLPTQDNASMRRGRLALHQVHNSATAELTGLLLIQRSTQEQASLEFDAETVLALIQYSAQAAEEMCAGQAMDLASKGRALTLDQLNAICFHKTGLAFEAALIMPAILARASKQEIAVLKAYAYHTGIAFQIKDDLLDQEGEAQVLGKPVMQDSANNTSTFVTVLGQEDARKQMWSHYCLAVEALGQLPRRCDFLRLVLDYMINRER
ncbi:polyprenyl synthetase family protein [Paenibacillus montanisoli]|uniref:Polyprenyl synthetase family protein n=1 Tax=Paenibacillus montanisoli TaxID=2081970 RepID=A0A328TWM6_9BACL|nr:polyprenyl synthetase family protein [Paenibacillus montanisoli]RAP74780.1 polyprenyl synthetase family protein [Paenibacillus montanisoli]